MTSTDANLFSVPELYLLAASFDAQSLFGLPEKQMYQLKGEHVFSDAYNRLKEKGILTESGQFTKEGAIVTKTLLHYYSSKKYVRIHNLMFAFQKDDEDHLIILVEVEEQEAYKLMIVAKPFVLKLLAEKMPLIGREPLEEEKTFIKKELTVVERIELETYEPNEDLMNMEVFHLEEEPRIIDNPAYYQQWIIFAKDERLIIVDTVTKKYYHASQYWFLKYLFDELEFPYMEATS